MKKRFLELLAEKSTWIAFASIASYFLNKYFNFSDTETVTTVLLGVNSLYLVYVKEHKNNA
jgi:hypothetical protein